MTKRRRKKKSSSLRKKLTLTFVILLCLGATLVYLKSRLWVFDLSEQYKKLITEEQELIQENNRLRLEVSVKKSPSQVEKIAKKNMGLRPRKKTDPVVIVVE
jgi:cell division protein FtsL